MRPSLLLAGVAGLAFAGAPARAAVPIPQAPPATPAPVASLQTPPAPVAGVPLVLDASASTPSTGIRSYEWTVTSGTGIRRTIGAAPTTVVRFTAPGRVRIALRVTDAKGRASGRELALRVAPAPPAPAKPAPKPAPKVAPAATVARAPRVQAASAGDPPVTIKDFSFGPASVTIHTGDTVTWTNRGPTEHTATATDKSFDTGILRKGRSASHTFRTAGTFAYICTLHPFMKASVTVLAAAASTPAPAAATPAAAAPARSSPAAPPVATPAATGPELPVTGGDPLAPAIAGAGLLAAGLALRRRAPAQR